VQAQSCARALLDAGRAAAPPLREYADALEAAQHAYAKAEAAAEDADRDASRAEDGSRAQREARADAGDAHRAMSSAREAALAANERAAAAIGALMGRVPAAPAAPVPPSGTAGDPGESLDPFALSLIAGSKSLDALGGAAVASRRGASRLGRELRTSPDRAARSTAARGLPQAGRTAKTISRFARPLGPVGPVLDLAANRAQGRGWGESVGRTAISGVGAVGLGGVAAVGCGAVTFGLAAAACGAGGAVAGGFIGDQVGDLVFGDD